MDVGKSFTFMFEDKDWFVKILIGGVFSLLSMILIGIPFVLGYALEVIRRAARQDPEPLPPWDNLGEMFVQGLLVLVIVLIWTVPIWLLSCVQVVFTAPLGGTQGGEGLIAAMSIFFTCLYLLWGLVVAAFTPAIYTRFALTEQFSSGFQFAELWDYTRRNIANIIIALLLSWVAGLVASFGVILCVIGVFLTWFWSQIVQAHLFGQVYAAGEGRGVPAEA